MKLNRTSFRPNGQYQVTRPGATKDNDPIIVSKFGTMSTAEDATNLELNEFTELYNADVIDGYISRRNGNTLLTPAKPNSNKILKFWAFQKNDGTVVQLRFTRNTIHRRGAGSWTLLTGTLTGSDDDAFSFATSNDSFFCANGVDKVIELNLTANTYAEIASSRPYKYIAAIGTRIVGAFNNDPGGYNPIEIGTSGNLNFTDWDPSSDFSAYRAYLYESQDDYTDFITGLAGVGETAVVVRERTIWLGEPQPVAQQPFYFFPKILNIGSDTPNSVQKVAGGIVFADRRTNQIYFYDPRASSGPVAISLKVFNEMNLQAYDPLTIFSGWDPTSLSYVIGIPEPASTDALVWKYSFKTQGWTRDNYYRATSFSNVPYSTPSITIDDISTTINDIVGSINDISPVVQTTGAQFIGTERGDIYVRSGARDTDESSTGDLPIDDLTGAIDGLTGDIDSLIDNLGGEYTTTIITKNFELADNNLFIKSLKLFIQPIISGDITISYSKDAGVTWITGKTISHNSLDKGKRVIKEWMKLIRARQVMFKFETTSGLFKIVKISIANATAGEIRE